MCLLLSEVFHLVKDCLCPEQRALSEEEEERIRAMPGIVDPNSFPRREGWRPAPAASVHSPSSSRSRAYSTRSNMSNGSASDTRIRFPDSCPAGERAIQQAQQIQDQMIQEQRQDLMVLYGNHHTYMEPPPSSTSSAVTLPFYGNANYSPELALRRSRIGKPKISRTDIPHAPPPGQRRHTVWNPYTSFNEPYVGDWSDEPFRTATNLGYRLPGQREKMYSYLDDFANIQEWMRGSEERERREQRDRRLAEAVKIPPPRDPLLLPKRPLAMPGAFPSAMGSQGHWYGEHHPQLPNGVRWRAGGSLPSMRPQMGVYGLGSTDQSRYRSLGRNIRI